MPILQGRNVAPSAGAVGAMVRGFSTLLSDQGRRPLDSSMLISANGGSIADALAANLEERKPGTQAPSVSGSDIAGQMPPGFSDHTWHFWFASAATRNGFTALASITGQPNTYTFTGNTSTFDKNRGRPWTLGGVGISVTKCGGARVKGNLSYNQNYHYLPGRSKDIQQALEKSIPMPWQTGETLTGEVDNANTSEVSGIGLLVVYGGIPHRYPRDIDELCANVGLVPTEIWTPQVSFTPGANAWGTASPLDTCSQEDAWLDADSVYYILGFQPHLVITKGFLNVVNNLPAYWKSRQATIPFGPGAQTVLFDGDVYSLPFEPIGPFEGTALPSLSAAATAATATTGSLIIAKV